MVTSTRSLKVKELWFRVDVTNDLSDTESVNGKNIASTMIESDSTINEQQTNNVAFASVLDSYQNKLKLQIA